MTDLKSALREDIIKSGLPTEIQVSSMLEQDNWVVINQYPYVDKNTGKIRTFDIQAIRAWGHGKSCILLIECKKATDHQWVFYTQTFQESFINATALLLEDFAHEIARLQATEKIAQKSPGPFCSIHPTHITSSKIGNISYVPFGKKDDFNEARNQILSAICSRGLTAKEDLVVYPAIVFDGEIYEVEVMENDVKLTSTDYVRFLSTMITELYPVLIDIVTLKYFPSYLDMLNKELGPSPPLTEVIESILKKLNHPRNLSK